MFLVAIVISAQSSPLEEYYKDSLDIQDSYELKGEPIAMSKTLFKFTRINI